MREPLPVPAEPDLTAPQRAAVEVIRSGPRGEVVGPFTALLHSPELCTRVAAVGEFIRYHSAVAERHVELVILCVARHWDQDFEWGYHVPLALTKGVPQATVDAIAAGREPEHADPEAAAVWRLVTELLDTRRVRDDSYADAVTRLGAEQVIELVTTAGYYTTLAMVMNTALTAPPAGAPRLPTR
ncbi:carboxymuconolactone decarboxylase family protein [Mycolicibacterium sp.]|uniref:carboxymuconolactone decarboxylase family protein n=1 Tax=Mycolicibacterium sp. TaxID=2320850 RepID=UPI003D0D20F0